MDELNERVNELTTTVATNKVRAEHISEGLDKLEQYTKDSFGEVKEEFKEVHKKIDETKDCLTALDKKNDEQHAHAQVKQIERHNEMMKKIDHIVMKQENSISNKFWKFFGEHPKITIIGIVILLGALGVNIGGLDINAMISSFMGVKP